MSRVSQACGRRAMIGAPGFNGALLGAGDLPMGAAVTIVVILAWAVIPTIAGAWRTRTQDA